MIVLVFEVNTRMLCNCNGATLWSRRSVRFLRCIMMYTQQSYCEVAPQGTMQGCFSCVHDLCFSCVHELCIALFLCARVVNCCAHNSWFVLMCARGVFPMCSTDCAFLLCTNCVLLSCVHGLFYGVRKGCVSFSCVHGLCFAPFPELGTPAFMGGKHLCQRITARDHLWEMTYEEDCRAFLSRMSGLWGARNKLSFHILTLVARLCHGHIFMIFGALTL